MQLTSKLKYQILFAVICCACMGMWQLAGQKLYENVIYQRRLVLLNDTAVQLTQRAEEAVDLAVFSVSDLLLTDLSVCNDGLREKLRKMIMDTTPVTGVFVVSQTDICAAAEGTNIPLPLFDERTKWHAGRNPLYRAGIVYGHYQQLIGVSRGLGSSTEIIMVLDPATLLTSLTQTQMFSTMETALFVGGDMAFRTGGNTPAQMDELDITSLSPPSTRYPVSVRLRSNRAALLEAVQRPPVSAIVPWWILGVMISVCIAILLLRRYDPKVEDVRMALKKGHIRPNFQPIVEASTGRVWASEALARWVKPDGQIISPDAFIPIIEEHDFDDTLLASMFTAAKQDLHAVLDADPHFYIGFNITPAQMSRKGFAALLMSFLMQAGLRPSQVCVEITERQVISDPEMAAINAADLREAGLCLAIDDAGTGHNGLAALQLLNVDVLKIDKFFIDHISTDPKSRIMLDTFVSVAEKSDMKTVAEGVETMSQFDILQAAGVTSIQGHYFSKALAGDEFTQKFFTDWVVNPIKDVPQRVVNY